jgi:hypothetical protein
MDLRKERELLFDSNFNVIDEETENQVIEFCEELTRLTGIQCCTNGGALFEYVERVYNSVVNNV